VKIVFGLFSCSFLPISGNNSTSLALVLDHCSGVYAAMIKRQSQLLLPARNGIGSGEQRNKWQGPAVGGKDAVYAGCELEPMEWSATKAGDLLSS
jgi:hypothetical protein